LVKRVTEEQKTKGGIIIPDSAKEKPVEGTVIAAGNGKVMEDGKVRPLDVTAALLLEQWRLAPNEPEFTIMRVRISGRVHDEPQTYTYHLYDETDPLTGVSSMARTTGYTCTGVARLLLDGTFSRVGICPPEMVGADAACFARMLAHLDARGVHCRR